jgi:plastocyanin
MRFLGQALLASVFVLGACAGGEKSASNDSNAAAAPAAASADSASAATTAAAGTAAPITGQIHEVKMIGDDKGYRFEPSSITIKVGDGVKFVNVSGGPHNVAFDSTAIPAGAAAQLGANMPNAMAPLQSNFLMQPNEVYTVSFAGVPAGTYTVHCTPHLAMNMKGTITVQQ